MSEEHVHQWETTIVLDGDTAFLVDLRAETTCEVERDLLTRLVEHRIMAIVDGHPHPDPVVPPLEPTPPPVPSPIQPPVPPPHPVEG